ncbi:MAG: helix-turn-helix domain-containing protein [Kangiellaceae bacterium]|nr:helix-turn-helix domain-containing protein [Kangiellaceae bacterium]
MQSKQLATHLREIRNNQGFTLSDLAEKSGVSRATLSRIENDEVSPTAETLGHLSSAYQLPISVLLSPLDVNFDAFIGRESQKVWVDQTCGFTRTNISPPSTQLKFEIVKGQLQANQKLRYDKPSILGQEHHLIIISGKLNVTVETNQYQLSKGDCLRYKLSGSSIFETRKIAAEYLITIATER